MNLRCVCFNKFSACNRLHKFFLCNLFVFLQVNIQVPAPDQQSDKIAITGLANHLDRARGGLLERVKELQAEQEDRVSIV